MGGEKGRRRERLEKLYQSPASRPGAAELEKALSLARKSPLSVSPQPRKTPSTT